MKSQKVIHILHSIEFSGAEIMLYQAAEIFQKHQIQTTLLACELKKGKFEEPMLDIGYRIDSVGTTGKISSIMKFFQYFRAKKYEVVHIHTEDLYLWKVIALKLTGHHNIVRSFHNNWTFKGWIRFKRILHRKIATVLGVKNHAIGPAVQSNEKKIFYNKSIVINNWIKLNPGLLLSANNIRAIKRNELGIEPDAFVIISIGGCSPIKNHNFIIDLMPLLSEAGIKVTYLHVGTGVDEAAEKARVKNISNDSKIIFTGNRKDIPELLICADIYLMPSLFEGLSIALLEAMYYNGLVIVNEAPGLSNMVINNSNGYVISVDDTRAYIDIIQKLSKNNIKTASIKAAARTFVEQNFSMEKNAEELIGYYKQDKNS
jgi:glycosyltransferase involved in cell wall biosynthesis